MNNRETAGFTRSSQSARQGKQSPLLAPGRRLLRAHNADCRSAVKFALQRLKWRRVYACYAITAGEKDKGPGLSRAFAARQYALAYFSELLIEVNLLFRLVPRPLTTAMIASEMPAAIRPYSMAVAPDWSITKRAIKLFIGTPCVHVAGRLMFGLAGVLSTVTMASP